MTAKNTTQDQPQSIPEGADRGFVRFAGTVTPTELPQLKLQAPEITDRGVVRFGSSCITSER